MAIRKNGLFTIENKLIGPSEVQKLANIIWAEYQIREKNSADKFFKSHVKCFEHYTYEDDCIKIFDESSEIYKESVRAIEITAKCDTSLYIKLRIQDGQVNFGPDTLSNSDIEIGGDNFEKIHDIHARVKQEIKSFPEQNIYLIKYHYIFSKIIFVLGTISFGFIIDLVNTNTANYTIYWRSAFSGFVEFLIYTGLATFIGGLGSYAMYTSLIDKAGEYWPIVELNIGPEHLRPKIKQRKFWIKFYGLVILPILLAIFYDITKAILYLMGR